MPKVSIIVPIYNAEKTIVRCLDSLVKQTYQDVEIILINDGSKDNSCMICEQYTEKYSWIKLINQENKGPATARNEGIDRAQGKYVYFVDADDYVESELVESMVKVAEENNAEMVICNYFQEEAGKKRKHEYKYESGLYEEEEAKKIAIELISDVSEKRIPPYSWVRMVRKDILETPKLRYSDGMVRSEDYYFYVQVHFRVKRLYLLADKPLYHYMEIDNSVTHKYVKDYWKSVKEIYVGLNKELPPDKDIKKRLDIMLIQRSMIALNNSARVQKKEVFKAESYEIMKENFLNNSIKQISFREGLQNFKIYYILMKMRAYVIIYARYYWKLKNKH